MGTAPCRNDLEDRLIDFAVEVIDVAEALPKTRAGNHIAGQLIRSGTSPAPNYAEAQGAESRNDFVHKLKVAFKELRETRVWLRIISRKQMTEDTDAITSALRECMELVRIVGASLATANNGCGSTPSRHRPVARTRGSASVPPHL